MTVLLLVTLEYQWHMVTVFQPIIAFANIELITCEQVLRCKHVIDMVWFLHISVMIQRWSSFGALKFIKVLVIHAKNANLLKFPDNVGMVPPSIPFVPAFIAIQITAQEKMLIQHSCLVKLKVLPHLSDITEVW